MSIRITDSQGRRPRFTQWDADRVLRVEGCESRPFLHFSNPELSRALVVPAEQDGSRWTCRVPNFLLQFSCPIQVSVYLQEDEGRTALIESFPVRPRPKPQDYAYTENVGYVNWVQKSAQAQALLDELEARAAGLGDQKLDRDQGAANAGKFLQVGADGLVVPAALAVWEGGSY